MYFYEEASTNQNCVSETDELLVEKFINNGDNGSFEELLSRHMKTIKTIARVVLNNNPDDICDVIQEIILELFLKLKNFRFQSKLKTYLYRIARNKAIDYLRRNKRLTKNDEVFRASVILFNPCPSEAVINHDKRKIFDQVLATESELDRTILVLKEVEGLKISFIAEIINKSPGSVRIKLHRIRKRLYKKLKGVIL